MISDERRCVLCHLRIKPGEAYRAEMHGDEHNSLFTCIDKLEAENARLRAALEFYADPNTWAALILQLQMLLVGAVSDEGETGKLKRTLMRRAEQWSRQREGLEVGDGD